MMSNMNKLFIALCLMVSAGLFAQESTPVTNPVMWADVPDMSITRNGDDYFLISTTMHLMPGAPVMHSKDLVHWEIASYVFDKITDTPNYDLMGGVDVDFFHYQLIK